VSQPDQFGQLDLSFQAAMSPRRIWRPRDLLGTVRTVLEKEFTDIWVEGEISNLRPAESGNLYFTLKDDDAQLRIVMFRTQARLLRFRPENGLQVVARGRITAYEVRGDLQLLAEYLEPKGAGALQVAFEQLKAKLAAEGLFDAARKKPIPLLPRNIGIVTSPRGAAIQDILNILRRRHASVNVLLYPAQVQGVEAPTEIAAGIKHFNRSHRVDVIIVARGGGSAEDLAAFNHEGLARTMATSELPVISAVGHETDFTIADFVADLRAPTPSAAAELVVQSQRHLDDHVSQLRQRLGRATRYQLMQWQRRLSELVQHAVFARMADAIARRQQGVDELAYRLTDAYRRRIESRRRLLEDANSRLRHFDLRLVLARMRQELDAHKSALESVTQRLMLQRRGRLERSTIRLQELSPLKILDRGYALVYDAKGKLIKDEAQVDPGDNISARLARGTIAAVVRRK
jgi:exodeoxyribonuclease VII large subunit